MLSRLQFKTLALDAWKWAGPYTLETEAKDALPLLDVSFAPELDTESVAWQGDLVPRQSFDFRELFELDRPTVAYVRGVVESEESASVLLGVQVDYFAKVWLNGELISVIDYGHGNPKSFVYVPTALKAGQNIIEIKVAAGAGGHNLSLAMAPLDVAGDVFMSTTDDNELDVSKRPQPTFANVPYGPDERNVMDVWLADSEKPVPCVLHIHGGGWLGGDKSKVANPQPYLDAGISYIAINYRFLPQTIIDTGSERGTGPIQPRGDYPEPPVDVPNYDSARALQFVRSQANAWNLDKNRIGLTGGSAGACTSLWLAFHDDLADPDASDSVLRESTRVWCAAVEGAQTTLDPVQILEWIPNGIYGGHAFGYIWDRSDPTSEMRSFLADRENVKDWIAEYSPYELLTPDDPPVYLFYRNTPEKGKAIKDATHSANYGAILSEKLEALGMDYEFVHAGSQAPRYASMEQFLIDTLKK
ncbi:alpha/beta hydrolase [Coraliomargarita algicola]|uniref:Alpha/beta hydrolase n=1 Tax=Coraliomargarita algicola TaxID=3092156 RepID=A0ABZ0RKF5_9BACT|nr:alpha/beta hydrolase [Coraliomargarita sp. J2-16]WPJ96689.1 alpha/beta hydrolase [Coraliomargarita sp. J2-16]